ncbi:hypothetical protein FJZ40_00030 [Candidatus Shapirobacteria bacterium]|nr:hypothetical protein [Candidatus Shapirobacteria bacterium]
MKTLRKLLYLLQLEEYQNERYLDWLKRYRIQDLEERKNKLRWTTRTILTLVASFLFIPLFGEKRAVSFANSLVDKISSPTKEIIIFLAKIKLMFYPKLIKIVITGSYGKTTLKEMLAYVLEHKYQVAKTPANINTQIGIALLVLRKINNRQQVLIIEAAAYQRGDIKAICQLVKPNFGVITSIGWMHLERFKTLENIRQTKMELVPFITDRQRLFLPTKDHEIIDPAKVCLSIGAQLNISPSQIKKRIKLFAPPAHRLTTKRVSRDLVYLDDSYNSNPLGFRKALDELAKYKAYQKIIITPGMIEFGKKQNEINCEIAAEATKICDIFLIVGKTNRESLARGAKGAKRIIFVEKNQTYETVLTPLLRPPTVILIENELPDHYF